MHVHLTARGHLQRYAAWGVTGVRDMGSDYDRVNVGAAVPVETSMIVTLRSRRSGLAANER